MHETLHYYSHVITIIKIKGVQTKLFTYTKRSTYHKVITIIKIKVIQSKLFTYTNHKVTYSR